MASGRTEHRDRLRAQIVRDAAQGVSNAQIARSRNLCVDTVRTWRRRFAVERLDGLTDRPRSGRPPVHGPVVRAEVVALACALPAEHGVPLSRWSCPEIARELFLSLNTLRTHNKHIFGKLGVGSRPAAVRRAEQLGLL